MMIRTFQKNTKYMLEMEYNLPQSLRPDPSFPRNFQVGSCYAKFNTYTDSIPNYTYLGSFVKEDKQSNGPYNRNFSMKYIFTNGTAGETDKYRKVSTCSPFEVEEWNMRIPVALQSKKNRNEYERKTIADKQRATNIANEKSKELFSYLQKELKAMGHNATIEHAPYDASILQIKIIKDAPLSIYARRFTVLFDTKTQKLRETDIFATVSLDKTLFPEEEIQRIHNDVERVFQSYYTKNTTQNNTMKGGMRVRSAKKRSTKKNNRTKSSKRRNL